MNRTYLRRSSHFLVYSAIQFILLTAAAMIFYSGGNLFDKRAAHYSIHNNFFSDLGGTITYNGQTNTLCLILFVIALCTVGLAMIYYSFTPRVYSKGPLQKFATLMLLLSGVCFILVALIPYNLYFDLHLLLVKLAFPFLMLYIASTLILQVRAKWPKFYQLVNLIYLLLLIAYVFILFFGPKIGAVEGLKFQAIAQKIIVYASIVLLGIQAFGIRRYLS